MSIGGRAVAAPATSDKLVVVVAVPDLRWSDLANMPHLAAYAEQSSVGDLSVRSEPASARCADGSLTFASGNRADAGGTTSCALSPAKRASLASSLAKDKYGSHIGAFGDRLASAGVGTLATSAAAALLIEDSAGRIPRALAPGSLNALGGSVVGVELDDGLYDAPVSGRVAAAHQLDTLLATQLAQLPASATVIVAGTSDGLTGGPSLHVVLIHGPGWRHVELGASTPHAHYVQLIDLAPTVLSVLHLSVPASMIGHPVHDTTHAAPSAADFVDANRHDHASRQLDGSIRTAFAVMGILVLVLVVIAYRRRSETWHRTAVWVARLGVGLPLATYLLQLVPWWRPSLGWYPAMLAGVMVMLAALTTIAMRRGVAPALVLVPGLTVAMFVIDELVGGPLQASAPLGNLALVAGRLHGIGNIAFACLCPAALLCAGVVGGVTRDAGRRRIGLGVAAVICVIAAAIDAAPRWGDDFGGLLAMTPAAALLLVLLGQWRLTVRRVVVGILGVIVVAVALAAADYSRPAADQDDIGTFAGKVIHGGAGRTISRKLSSDLLSFGNVFVTGSVVLLLILAVTCRPQVSVVLHRAAGLWEAAIAVTLLAVVGTALNDSGVVIAQFALVLVFLAIVGSGVAAPPSERMGHECSYSDTDGPSLSP